MADRQLTARQRAALAQADSAGAVFVTMIDGRATLILPPRPESELGPFLVRVAEALQAAGIGTTGEN